MYRILIADDEPLEREGMTLILNNIEGRQLSINYAVNGNEALQQTIISKPHIALMDIRMPGLNGLQAIKQMKMHQPNLKVVLISAYEYFDYAKEAIQLGVRDYLVKPAKRQEIVSLIETLLNEVDAEQEKERFSTQENQKLQLFSKLAHKELALRIMDYKKDDYIITTLAELIDFTFNHGIAVVISLPISNSNKKTEESTIHDILENLLGQALGSELHYVISPIINEHITLFISADDSTHLKNISTQIREISDTLRRKVNDLLSIPLYIGVGLVKEQLSGITHSYFEAVFASTNVNEDHPICFFDEITERSSQPLQIINNNQSAYVKNVIHQIKQERDIETHSMINRVTTFIQQNYNRDLLLEEAADYVHLNPFYFSKVFKQLTGATFIDYLTEVRITHAKRLMANNELSLKEICYLVGYNDPNYLSRVFKKVVGLTPSEYRQTLN